MIPGLPWPVAALVILCLIGLFELGHVLATARWVRIERSPVGEGNERPHTPARESAGPRGAVPDSAGCVPDRHIAGRHSETEVPETLDHFPTWHGAAPGQVGMPVPGLLVRR